jgi:hypothetical protein
MDAMEHMAGDLTANKETEFWAISARTPSTSRDGTLVTLPE